jgi:glycosyltransferase involved in cell wall biosynthesis
MTRPACPRLLCVSHYFESHRGGIEIVAGQLARSLHATGTQITWAAADASPPPNDIDALVLPSCNIIERRSGLPFPLPGLTALARLLRTIARSGAVLVHDGMYPSSIAAILVARLFRRPAILVQHIGRVDAPSRVQRFLFTSADRLLTRPMVRIASQTVFISATSARHFSGVRTRRPPVLIFNGVDCDTFRLSRNAAERERDRVQAGWPEDRPIGLFVGRFLEKKGLLRLRDIAAARPHIHWAFAGWGPCDPEAWGLPNVSVHRNCLAPELSRLYRAADLLVLPSKSEGFPLVVQEALACGLRPLCCDDAAEADPATAPYLTGIANAGSEQDIVENYLSAVDRLLATSDSDEARIERSGFARERYSWAGAARRYAAIIDELSAAHQERVPSASAAT